MGSAHVCHEAVHVGRHDDHDRVDVADGLLDVVSDRFQPPQAYYRPFYVDATLLPYVGEFIIESVVEPDGKAFQGQVAGDAVGPVARAQHCYS